VTSPEDEGEIPVTFPQAELYERFKALHEGPGFVMPNAWDGLSARMIARAGFPATATSSAALAHSLGLEDGRHQVSREVHLRHAQLIQAASGLPVNGDLEDGYGDSADEVAATVEAAIAAGLAGAGIEDTTGDPDHPIRDFDDAVSRVRAAVAAARGRLMITGRTDNFIQGREDLDDTIRRLTAFADVGADVLYAPMPPDMAAIRAILTAVSPKPVNVLVGPWAGSPSTQELFSAGVRRISTGSALYAKALATIEGNLSAITRGEVRPG
jgi:2-methylisocitrate lyase-like PEP mutase family enzyme